MNRLLPVILTVVILLGVLGGGFFAYKKLFTKPTSVENTAEEEDDVKMLSVEEAPYTTLVPGPSCEYTLNVSQVKGNPASVEYEIVYKNGEGVTQGATGTMKLNGSTSATKKILFGSESSGKRRCDPGVSGGSITLRYRNDAGKLLSKAQSNFSLTEDSPAVAVDAITATFTKAVKGKVLAMGTMGLPGKATGSISAGPYGVFTNSATAIAPTIAISGSGNLNMWDGSAWTQVTGNKPSKLDALVLIK